MKEVKCSICKLEFDKDDVILQYPDCKHLFHKEHIENWLSSILAVQFVIIL
ncbi:MAG: hypothetical protein FK734_01200 [Asgard group archaeon]|nr:hypothetical protein [Asgard group archaeon]